MGGNGCLIATSDGIYHAPAFKVSLQHPKVNSFERFRPSPHILDKSLEPHINKKLGKLF